MASAQEIVTAGKLGERIQKLMEKEKLTQADLAKDIGITRQTLAKYIKGERQPKADVLQSIADRFNMSVDELTKRDAKRFDDETTFLLRCSEYTGLSFEALKMLNRLIEYYDIESGRLFLFDNGKEFTEMLSDIISHNIEILYALHDYVRFDGKAEINKLSEERTAKGKRRKIHTEVIANLPADRLVLKTEDVTMDLDADDFDYMHFKRLERAINEYKRNHITAKEQKDGKH